MSMPFSGIWGRGPKLVERIAAEVNKVNFKPVKKVQFRFDPFHEKVQPTRWVYCYFTGPKRFATNRHCIVSSSIVCDRSEPLITIDLVSGEKVILQTENLSTLEILELYNKHISSTVPPEEDPRARLKKKKKKNPKKSGKGIFALWHIFQH